MRERHRRLVAALPLERVPVDRVAVEPGRRAGLEPSALEAQLGEALAERDRGVLADAPAREAPQTDVDHAVQERAGRDDRGATAEAATVVELDRGDAAALEPHAVRDAGHAREAGE